MIEKKFILIFFTSIFLFSCSKNKIIDFDISDLPKRKNIKPAEKVDKELVEGENKKFIKDLDIFESKEKVLTKFKIGKKDPFSKGETETGVSKFSSNFKLTGFLNTEIKKYVFVSYLGYEGSISEDSIGGLNTNLLPNGAKVIAIDSGEKQLRISFNNEDYIFEL